MKEILLNGYYLEMYDSIEDLPERRFQAFNRYALIDSGIGADLDSVGRHISMIREYNKRGMAAEVESTAEVLYQSLAFVMMNVNPELYCFTAMVKTVNGKPWEDYSEGGAKKLSEMLSSRGLTVGKIRGFLQWVKKKLTRRRILFSRN